MLNKVLWVRANIIVLLIMFFDGPVYGFGEALMPIAAVKLFGYTTPQWSQLVAIMGLIGAVIALALGPLIDRFGAKHMLLFTVALVGVHAFLDAGEFRDLSKLTISDFFKDLATAERTYQNTPTLIKNRVQKRGRIPLTGIWIRPLFRNSY